MSAPGGVGFYGKLPGVGDFVQRRLPAGFVAAWDACFQAGVDATRSVAGGGWHALWPATPLWRFALAPGVCDASGWVGVMGPSIDRVGRTFPMVLASPLANLSLISDVVGSAAGWFAALERACRGASAGAPLTADDFDTQIAGLPDPQTWLRQLDSVQPDCAGWPATATRVVAWQPSGNDRALVALAAQCFGVADGCLWWTLGSCAVPPSARLTHGLPQPATYTEMVGAASLAAMADNAYAAPPTATAATDDVLAGLFASKPLTVPDDGDATVPLGGGTWTSSPRGAAPTQTAAGGAVRQVAGATLIAADNGPADPRRMAAAEVHAALAGVQWWEADADALRARVLALHADLLRRREDLLDPVPEDGAVIAARLRGDTAAIWWIGSAAAWLWRQGQLRALRSTEATAAVAQDDVTRPAAALVTAPRMPLHAPGLGAAAAPRWEAASCGVAPGDRLLLVATDTLVALSEGVLAAALAASTAAEVCSRLAAVAKLGGERTRWPLAVIEVGT